jgi:SNF2 family DNA or RNA helicase
MIAELLEKDKIPFVELHGGVVQKDRDENVRRFRNDADCRVIVANQGAAGIGINLTEASYSVFYSRSFSLEHDLQAEARNYRGGSEIHSSVTRVDLIAPGTIDELIAETLNHKQDIASRILDWKP